MPAMRTTFLAGLLAVGPAAAEVTARFVEGAPNDVFEIDNSGACDFGPLRLDIDLSGAPAGLLFDVTAGGPGVLVFQPLRLVAGAEQVTGLSELADGDRALALDLAGLPAGARIVISVDIDGTLANGPLGQTRVAGAEIAGATLRVVSASSAASAAFDAGGVARVAVSGCTS